ncbi:MAG: MFS transporter [Ilumatobacteraceae bacterium]
MSPRRRLLVALLLAAVALAFADASVVALALPELYGEFDTTIVGVSWVLTTYALAVALAAIPVAVLHRRVHPLHLVLAGAGVFAAASIVAGVAGGLEVLLGARAAQGVGAALLLAGSLPVLVAVVPGTGRGRRWWAMAAAVGAAIGPALGGVLTEAFSWRAIFLVQAPIVAGALAVASDRSARAPRDAASAPFTGHGSAGDDADGAPRRGDVAIANAGFALVFAALVAALFLGVLMAIEVWRYSPAQSALLVSALPLGMILGRLVRHAPAPVAAVGGALLLALGLTGLAVVPGAAPLVAALSFAICGVGFDLVHEVLDASAVPPEAPPVRAGAVTVSARHAGLVLGLALIAPVLSTSLVAGIERATLGATQTMLLTDLQLSDKIPVTWALREAIDAAPRGQVPDLAAEFDARGAEDGNAMARARDDLMDTVTDAVTRSFRPAFAIAAVLAALAALPAAIVARRRPASGVAGSARRRTWSTVGIGAVAVVGLAAVGTQFARGADTGEFVAEDPCTAAPDQFPGDGLDASVQRIALSALNGAACELGTTRERLVLSLDPNSSFDDVTWDRDTMEEALRNGSHRAIDDANDRDAIPGWVAAALGFVVDRAPVDWLVDRLPIPGG